MRIWLALLAAPSIALACQSIMYSLVTPSCSVQTRVMIHVVALVSLAACVVFTLLARGGERHGLQATSGSDDHDGADPATSRRFLVTAAAAVGAISSLVVLMMWVAAWVLSPCLS